MPRLKSLLPVVVPLGLISPSALWLARDRSVWPWDQAWYGQASVELFYTLLRAPARWPGAMLAVLEGQAPGLVWFGQLFVPLGRLLGSFDDGLLTSILVTQGITLALVYRSLLEVTEERHSSAIAGCLMVASAPLFVGLSHQYLAEPLQLLAVAWFVLIMVAAPRWSGAATAAQLTAAAAVALLAKVSSPLYCLGPGVVALRCLMRRRPLMSWRSWREPRVAVSGGAAVILVLAAAAWYRRNLAHVTAHLSAAAAGPIAEIYGGSDPFLHALGARLVVLHAALFRPYVAVAVVVSIAAAMIFGSRSSSSRHMRTSCVTAALQLVVVLCVLALSPNREPRFLLPVLPYCALLVGCALARMRKPLPIAAAAFSVQLALSHAQGLGEVPAYGYSSPWLLPPRTEVTEARVLHALVWRTCPGTLPRSERPWNIIGIELPWLNKNSAAYSAAKTLAPRGLVGCRYDSIYSFTVFDADELWRRIGEMDLRYYVTKRPEASPIPVNDPHLVAINRNYRPVLERLRASGEFTLEPPLPEDPDILIFRRHDVRTPRPP